MNATPHAFDVLVLGGGLSGLVAAFELQKRGLVVGVADANDAPGGVIGTRTRDGFLYETGARERSREHALRGEAWRAGRAADVSRRVPDHRRVHARREAAPVPRALRRRGAAAVGGVDRGVRAPPPRQRVPRLRDRPVRLGHLRGRPGADLGAGGVPPVARARAEVRQPDPRPDHGSARAPQEPGEGEERREELQLRPRPAGVSARARRAPRPLSSGHARRVDRAPSRRRLRRARAPRRRTGRLRRTRARRRHTGLARCRVPGAAVGTARPRARGDPLRARRRRGLGLSARGRRSRPRRVRLPGAEEGAPAHPRLAVLEQHVRGTRAKASSRRWSVRASRCGTRSCAGRTRSRSTRSVTSSASQRSIARLPRSPGCSGAPTGAAACRSATA